MLANCENIANYIIHWLLDYAELNSFNGFIVGVSGGVDSALVASLCARTNKQTILLNLPIHQSQPERSRAQQQINVLATKYNNVSSLTTDLSDTFDAFVKLMPQETKNDPLSLANSRARLRMTTLYAIAQSNRLLVTGTGNKIEDFGIGFFTKYGDGGVDISPIGDLFKSEVFQLANHLDVVEEILEAQPTDGLWGDNRNDEDQIGATYDELEFAMQFKGNKDELSGRELEVVEIYQRLNTVNQHKMKPIPVCTISHLK